MARKVDPETLGSAAPKLLPEDLEEKVAVLTIASYDEDEIEDDEKEGGKRKTAYLTFEETGDKRIYLNVGQAKTLVAKLGPDADKWIGQKVPVERHVAKFGNKSFPKVVVVAAEEWDDYLDTPKSKRAKSGRKGR